MPISANSSPDLPALEEKSASFTFSADLLAFLPASLRRHPAIFHFKGNQSVKHLVEAAGIPHTEIGILIANRQQVDLDYLVQDQDHIEVISILDLPPEQTRERESLFNGEPRFILDNHLGKLATYLRMLGFDCLYDPELSDLALARISGADHRILLTRDRRLLMRKIIGTGYFVRSKQPIEQTVEVLRRFDLTRKIQPFRRCLRCNHLLTPISKELILHRLQPKTRLYYDAFCICPQCDQIYWQGSHHERMQKTIQQILASQTP